MLAQRYEKSSKIEYTIFRGFFRPDLFVLAILRQLTTCSSRLELSSYQVSDRLDKNSRLRDLSKIAKNEHFLLIISLYQAVYGLLNLEPKGQRPKALNQRSRPKVHLTWLVLRAFTLLVVGRKSAILRGFWLISQEVFLRFFYFFDIMIIYHLQKTLCPRKIWFRRYASPKVREIVKNRIYYLQEPFST